jgi:hypothetical protein
MIARAARPARLALSSIRGRGACKRSSTEKSSGAQGRSIGARARCGGKRGSLSPGEKATSPPAGAVLRFQRHRRANSKHGLGAVGVGVFPSLPPVWARVHRRAPSRARRWWRPPRVRWRRTSRTRAPRAGTPRSTSAVASRSRAPGSSDGTRDSTRRGAVASDAPTATARTLEARNLRGEGRRPRSAYSARGMTRARARARPSPLARRLGLGPARNPARRASG